MDGPEPRSGRLYARAGRSLARDRSMVRRDRGSVREGVADIRVRGEYVLRPQSRDGAGAPVSRGTDPGRSRSARRADVIILTSLRATGLSLIHISEPTRLGMISYAVFCLKK